LGGPPGIFVISSPLARVSASAEESHPLNSPALLATILNDVLTFGIGLAFLNLHCLFAYDAVQETYKRAFIVIRMISRATHFLAFSPSSTNLWRDNDEAFGVVFLIDARLSKSLDQLFFRHDPVPIARLAMIANHPAKPFVDYAPVISFSEFKHFTANEALIQIAHSYLPS
jgi:hypothetical protein